VVCEVIFSPGRSLTDLIFYELFRPEVHVQPIDFVAPDNMRRCRWLLLLMFLGKSQGGKKDFVKEQTAITCSPCHQIKKGYPRQIWDSPPV
jgi:hypothetical protein